MAEQRALGATAWSPASGTLHQALAPPDAPRLIASNQCLAHLRASARRRHVGRIVAHRRPLVHSFRVAAAPAGGAALTRAPRAAPRGRLQPMLLMLLLRRAAPVTALHAAHGAVAVAADGDAADAEHGLLVAVAVLAGRSELLRLGVAIRSPRVGGVSWILSSMLTIAPSL